MSYLFITHEAIGTTPVAKAMFWDIAVKLSKEENIIFVSGDKVANSQKNLLHVCFSADRGDSKTKRLLSFFLVWMRLCKYLFRDITVICRSYPSMLFFGTIFAIFGKRVVFDTRGLFLHELYDSGKKFIKNETILLRIDALLLSFAQTIICVSDAQKRYYWSLKPEKEYKVIYNGAPLPRRILDCRSDGKIKLAYVGSLVKWHSIERILGITKELSKLYPCQLTIITRDIDTAKKMSKEYSLSVIVKTANFRDQAEQHDLAFCLIAGGLSKDVCCPVKFAEYLQSKNRVIASSNVEFHRQFIQHNRGVLIDLNHSDADIARKILSFHCSSKPPIDIPSNLQFDFQINKFFEAIRV